MQDFKGKVCIVTGAASGIGKACAEEIGLRCKAKLTINDINEEGLQKTLQEIRKKGGEAIAVAGDLCDQEVVDRIVSETVSTYGRLDFLSSNAAAVSFAYTGRDRAFDQFDADYVEETFRINTVTGFRLIKACIPEMLKNGKGAIVCISSVAARFGAAGNNIYGMSKAALEALVRGTAALYGRQGIRVNVVEPSNTITPALLETIPEEQFGVMKLGIFNPGFTDGSGIATVVSFLLSDDAYTIQGATIPADNGYSIVQGMAAAFEAAAKK